MFNQPTPKKHFLQMHITPVQMICLSFVAVILTGALLLMLPVSARDGSITPFTNALFTATSATCVTGLIVYDTYLHFSGFGQAVILLLIQVGGLGLVTFTSFLSLIAGRKLGFRSMDLAKESANTDSFGDVKRMLRTIITVTVVIEALGALVLACTFVPLYGWQDGVPISVFLAVSAFCNAGFDILGREGAYVSLMNYVSSLGVYIPIALLIIFGGLGFMVWREIFHYRKTKTLSLHSRLVLWMTGLLVLLGTAVFLLLEWNNPKTMGTLSFLDKLGAGFFQSVTTRTAGFNSIDQAGLTELSKIASIVLMFIGASPASTGGGIKVTTIAVVVMTIASVMHGYEDTIIMRCKVEKKAVYKAITLFALAFSLVFVCSGLIDVSMGANSGISFTDVVFEEVSAFGTVGLSAGLTAQANTFTKYLLILTMYFGRVGPLSLIVSLAMRVSSQKEVLPVGKILIG
ncbi:MAG: potassium transporter TrkG [Angelakisella sp.]